MNLIHIARIFTSRTLYIEEHGARLIRYVPNGELPPEGVPLEVWTVAGPGISGLVLTHSAVEAMERFTESARLGESAEPKPEGG